LFLSVVLDQLTFRSRFVYIDAPMLKISLVFLFLFELLVYCGLVLSDVRSHSEN